MKNTNTLKHLSEVLNISISTVSRALKNHPDISQHTKKKVQELAAAMDYEPNSLAVQLRTKESRLLGVLVPHINNFFYDSFIAAVEEEASLLGYSVMIMQTGDNADTEARNLKQLKKNLVSGIFVAISSETDNITPFLKMQESNIPVVFFDRVPEGKHLNKVCLADHDAASIAANAIINANKKNVLALFGHPNLSISKQRLASFKQVFEHNAPQTKLTVLHPDNMQFSKIAVEEALAKSERPDTIFCMGDLILIGTMQAIHERNLRVPEDISVISISNGLIPTLYNPKITYVETSGYTLGKAAFKRMMSCMNNIAETREVSIESVLVKGNSL
ncbi:MAG: LacI family DNA-binding transcriptional regulator [Bacteroidota bacterium]|nr:LacI family DNA-binding transcriptional regulator [Bacteroidota bacterium]